jgi:hypothetical protein
VDERIQVACFVKVDFAVLDVYNVSQTSPEEALERRRPSTC